MTRTRGVEQTLVTLGVLVSLATSTDAVEAAKPANQAALDAWRQHPVAALDKSKTNSGLEQQCSALNSVFTDTIRQTWFHQADNSRESQVIPQQNWDIGRDLMEFSSGVFWRKISTYDHVIGRHCTLGPGEKWQFSISVNSPVDSLVVLSFSSSEPGSAWAAPSVRVNGVGSYTVDVPQEVMDAWARQNGFNFSFSLTHGWGQGLIQVGQPTFSVVRDEAVVPQSDMAPVENRQTGDESSRDVPVAETNLQQTNSNDQVVEFREQHPEFQFWQHQSSKCSGCLQRSYDFQGDFSAALIPEDIAIRFYRTIGKVLLTSEVAQNAEEFIFTIDFTVPPKTAMILAITNSNKPFVFSHEFSADERGSGVLRIPIPADIFREWLNNPDAKMELSVEMVGRNLGEVEFRDIRFVPTLKKEEIQAQTVEDEKVEELQQPASTPRTHWEARSGSNMLAAGRVFELKRTDSGDVDGVAIVNPTGGAFTVARQVDYLFDSEFLGRRGYSLYDWSNLTVSVELSELPAPNTLFLRLVKGEYENKVEITGSGQYTLPLHLIPSDALNDKASPYLEIIGKEKNGIKRLTLNSLSLVRGQTPGVYDFARYAAQSLTSPDLWQDIERSFAEKEAQKFIKLACMFWTIGLFSFVLLTVRFLRTSSTHRKLDEIDMSKPEESLEKMTEYFGGDGFKLDLNVLRAVNYLQMMADLLELNAEEISPVTLQRFSAVTDTLDKALSVPKRSIREQKLRLELILRWQIVFVQMKKRASYRQLPTNKIDRMFSSLVGRNCALVQIVFGSDPEFAKILGHETMAE